MKTKITLFILHSSFLIFNCATAQVTFQKTYGGPEKEAAFKLAKTYDGGYALSGETESFGSNGRDIYLIKTDGNGVLQWSVVYSGIGADYSTNIIETSDHGFLIAGGTTSFGSGSDDALLLKTDATGVPLWSKVYGGSQQDYFLSVAQVNDGGFIAVGTTASYGAGSYDILVVRTNASGDTLWTRILGGTSYEDATNIIQTADSGFAFCGHSFSFTPANAEAVLIKLNANGDTTWTLQYGNTGVEEAHSVKQTADGGYIVFGNATSFGNDYEPYLNRFTSTGNLLWTKLYGGPKSDAMYDGIITSDGGYAMSGFTESFGEGHRGTDSSNYFAIRTNMSGDTLWTHTYGGDKVDESFCIVQADDGGFAMFGFSGSFGDSIEFYFVKTDSMGRSGCHEESCAPHVVTPTTFVSAAPVQINSGVATSAVSFLAFNPPTHENVLCLFDGINENKTGEENPVVFPNPFTNQTTIKFNKEIDDGILYLYDVYGQMVFEKSNIYGKQAVINADNLSSGVYIFELTEKGKRIYDGKAVVY